MRIEPGLHLAPATAGLQQPLGAFLAVATSIGAVLAVFWPTTLSMVEIWARSETFQHCFAVLPIVLWLIWSERIRLAATPVRPFWPGLLLIAALGFAWLLGLLGAAQVVSHFALIGIAAASVLTVFGAAWARVLWFPLVFLFFAVPFGEAIVPRLMDWTADFTVAALRLSGVPVFREGVHFVIPSGQWSVIEACSGIKFLIASVMAGSLYAWLMYRSTRRRLMFLAASIIVPVLANWLRAYFIVIVGHLSSNRLMTHDDHIVFGWILFAVVMLLTYWIGARWREDGHDGRPMPPAPRIPMPRLAAIGFVALVTVAVWPAAGRTLLAASAAQEPLRFVPPAPADGWNLNADGGSVSDWRPALEGEAGMQTFVYNKGAQRVAVLVAAFRSQTQEAQVGSSVNQLVRTTDIDWKQTTRELVQTNAAKDDGVAAEVHAAEVRAVRRPEKLLVWQWYWAGQHPTASAGQTKIELALARLLRRPDTALWIAAYTPLDDGRAEAEQAMRDFTRDMGPSLQKAFVETAR